MPASRLLQSELTRIDAVASRFRPDSELSAVNDAAGTELRVSRDLFEAVDVALGMAAATGGLVDPTVGLAMNRLGYDRDFTDVILGVEGELPAPRPTPGWETVELDPDRHTIRLPKGTALDLGATAKALASDRAASVIAAQLGCGALVSLGGDCSVAGPSPVGGFVIGIADTCTSKTADQAVRILTGGLASSGIGVRQWRLGTSSVHHILDPTTCLPARTSWRTVATTAATCVQANAASTAAIIKGEAALPWLDALAIPARLVRLDGAVEYTSGWPVPERPAVRLGGSS
jgi:thiamine biosynthesis lipoprotein